MRCYWHVVSHIYQYVCERETSHKGTDRDSGACSLVHQERDWKMSLSWRESQAEPLTYGIAASPRQPRSPHPAGMRWPCPCLWCHTPWSGSWVNSPTSPETPLAGMGYTGWPWEGNTRPCPNCVCCSENSRDAFILEFSTWMSWEIYINEQCFWLL